MCKLELIQLISNYLEIIVVLKCEDLTVFFVLRHSKVSYWTKRDKMLSWPGKFDQVHY